MDKRLINRITFISCFQFQDGGILTHKSANIGQGHFVKISTETEAFIKEITEKNVFQCEILRRSGESYAFDKDLDPAKCAPENVKKSNFKIPGTVEMSNEVPENLDEPEDKAEAKSDNSSLFQCPNELCSADYIRFVNYENHIRNGICKVRLRIMSQMNHVKILWFNKFGFQNRTKLSDESSRYLKTHLDELLEIVLPPMIELVPNCDGFSYDEPLKMGFAMKANQKLPKITEELKSFVKNLFNEGQSSNQKYTTAEMVTEIHKSFPMKEWLIFSQVKGMIGTLKAKILAKGSKDLDPAQLIKQAEDELALEFAIAEAEKAKTILNKPGNWLSSHPLEVCTKESFTGYITFS